MNRKFTYFSISSILLFAAGPAKSQTTPSANGAATTVSAPAAKDEKLPSPDELSEKCAKASGGKEAWAKVQTMVMTGTVEVPTFGASGTMETLAKRPNKVLRTTNIMDGQFVQRQGFDGQMGWTSDPQKGLRPLKGDLLEQMKVEATFGVAAHLKEVYPDMKVTDRAKIGDRDAFTAVAHESGGKTLTMYFDAETGVILAEDAEGPDEEGTVAKVNILLEDYRAAGDLQIPHRIRIKAPNVSVVIKIENVKLNEPVDDAKFAMPAPSSN